MNSLKGMPSRGVAMVEFAIVLPLLLMLLFGITELGRALYQQNSLYKAVASGARYLARVNDVLAFDTNGNCTTAGPAWPDSGSLTAAQNLIIYGNTAVTGTPLIPNLDASDAVTITVAPHPLPKTDGSTVNVCVITINAEAEFSGLFGAIVIPFTTLETFKIRAETEERYIGL
ncbi:MAG: pilus assembly protein [Gammaproteobacteria bacterium]|nr:pilus assembly protein [Gammaproteobacteria bacterium]